jgi:hypothetical protein
VTRSSRAMISRLFSDLIVRFFNMGLQVLTAVDIVTFISVTIDGVWIGSWIY